MNKKLMIGLWGMQYACMLWAALFLALGNRPLFIGIALLSYIWMGAFGKNIGIPKEVFEAGLKKRPKIIQILFHGSAVLLIVSLMNTKMNLELPLPISEITAFIAFIAMNLTSDSFLLRHYLEYSKELEPAKI